jgi:hypothetical protein
MLRFTKFAKDGYSFEYAVKFLCMKSCYIGLMSKLVLRLYKTSIARVMDHLPNVLLFNDLITTRAHFRVCKGVISRIHPGCECVWDSVPRGNNI